MIVKDCLWSQCLERAIHKKAIFAMRPICLLLYSTVILLYKETMILLHTEIKGLGNWASGHTDTFEKCAEDIQSFYICGQPHKSYIGDSICQ